MDLNKLTYFFLFNRKRSSAIGFASILLAIFPHVLFAQNPGSDLATSLAKPKVQILKRPYLIHGSDNTSMTVLWQLNTNSPCQLYYGKNTAFSSKPILVEPYNEDFQYKFAIDNLEPAAKYYYQVDVQGEVFNGSFVTAPENEAESIKFLAYGDTRTNVKDHDNVCEAINTLISEDPSYQTFILHSGDMLGNGNYESNWTNEVFTDSAENLSFILSNLPMLTCIGNHEGSGILFKKYWPYPYIKDQLYWSFDYGPLHVVFTKHIYEFKNEFDQIQLDWIEQDLKNTDKKWKIVMTHAPGWSAGGHTNSISVQKDLQP